jgi:hypothetical protein
MVAPPKKSRVSGAVTLGNTLTSLLSLLSPTDLNREVYNLNEAYTAIKPKNFYQSENTGSLVDLWANQQYQNSFLDRMLALLPKDSMAAAGIQLQLVQNAVDVIPRMQNSVAKMEIITRSFRYETCCSLVKIFEWYSGAGSNTADTLMQIHRAQGYQFLLNEAPQFARLVDHIVQYIYHLSDLKSKKPAKNKTSVLAQSVFKPDFGLVLDPQNISHVPADFYGFRNLTRPTLVKLPSIKDKILGYGSDSLYGAASYCLQELWSAEIFMPKLKKLDEGLSSGRVTNFDSLHVYQRSITRGAILYGIAEACGTDGIFASSQMDQFLRSPAIIFSGALSRERKFAPMVLQHQKDVLEPLLEWVRGHLADNPGIVPDAKRLSELADLQILELFLGKRISDEDPAIENLKKKSATKNSRDIVPALRPVTFEVLVDHSDGIQLGSLALIIREALNRERGHQPADEVLNRVLEGHHATRNTSTQNNPDHTNPIRQNLKAAILLRTHLPGELLTSPTGLSNLLSWMGTGQGFKTQNFLESFNHNKPFFSLTLEDMIERFQAAAAQNALIVSRYPGNSRPSELPGIMPVDDMLIWGQPNHLLSLAPTKEKMGRFVVKLTLHEKFAPYWAKSVQDSWVEFLGDILDKDPSEYTGHRQAWCSVQNLLENLNISAFGSGLTPFQLANNLVALEIVAPPTAIDIADWIYRHPKLGAFRGLQDLGFSVSNKNLMSVRGAYICIYNFFEEHLTKDDKKLLFFGPIFVEHILCKIPRWKKRLEDEDAGGRLEMLIEKVISDGEIWSPGENSISNKAFPVPLTIPAAWLKKTIGSILVCSLTYVPLDLK